MVKQECTLQHTNHHNNNNNNNDCEDETPNSNNNTFTIKASSPKRPGILRNMGIISVCVGMVVLPLYHQRGTFETFMISVSGNTTTSIKSLPEMNQETTVLQDDADRNEEERQTPVDSVATEPSKIAVAQEEEEALKLQSQEGGIFFCGYMNEQLAQGVFPDYMQRYKGNYEHVSHAAAAGARGDRTQRLPTQHDILVMGMHGTCHAPLKSFPGKVLFVNGEPFGEDQTLIMQLEGRAKVGDDVYQIGLVPTSNHTLKVYHGAWNLMQLDASVWPTLWDHSRKPINSGTYKGLMYMNGKCHAHREEAVIKISSVMTVYYGGKCHGANSKIAPPPNATALQRMPAVPKERHWTFNRETYSDYTFCLAMENSITPNYLSEKIIMAFLAGCIPIYYGSREVFDVFNRKAFVFWDPADEGAGALQTLQELISNDTAYQEMLHQEPIMANGDTTVRDYFSMSDSIGGGYLKQKLRTTMGLVS